MGTDAESGADPPREVTSTHDLAEAQQFVLLLDGLKEVARQNPLSHGDRMERVAEHSWHVALAVMLLHDASPDDVDVCHAMKMALVHDLAELYVGDTFAFGDDVETQPEREEQAMDQLRSRISSRVLKELVDLWYEYEAQATPEARFVKAMDVYLPIALNHANVERSSWRRHEVAADKVEQRVDRARRALGPLAETCDEWIDDARRRGYLT
jgi:5'-deoxynucleotidase YfbR-like HD superfamily hydrolase